MKIEIKIKLSDTDHPQRKPIYDHKSVRYNYGDFMGMLKSFTEPPYYYKDYPKTFDIKINKDGTEVTLIRNYECI